MAFRSGDFVAYLGRAGRVRGVESVDVAGIRLDALVIVHTALPRGVVHVPLRRVANTVKRISAAEVARMDETIVPPITYQQSRLQKARAAKQAKGVFVEFGRLGALAKARNRAA